MAIAAAKRASALAAPKVSVIGLNGLSNMWRFSRVGDVCKSWLANGEAKRVSNNDMVRNIRAGSAPAAPRVIGRRMLRGMTRPYMRRERASAVCGTENNPKNKNEN